MPKTAKRSHPTRDALIRTVLELLETTDPDDIKVQEVLDRSGISVGSLYHHFEDLSDLIDHAMVGRYAADVAERISILNQLLDSSSTRAEILAGLSQGSRDTHAASRSRIRYYRAQTMARAVTHDRFRNAFAIEQKKLTDGLADVVRQLQDRGYVTREIDTHTASVFIQSYSIGFILNDVSSEQVDQEAYVKLLERMLERVFFTE